jgi:hypothetical protein
MTREEAIKYLNGIKAENLNIDVMYINDRYCALKTAIKSLEAWDKVIEEIKEQFDGCDICEWFEDYDYDENNISEYRYAGSVDDILDIIKKHFGEVEE